MTINQDSKQIVNEDHVSVESDTESDSSDESTIDDDEMDNIGSITSNTFFLFGGIFYVTISIWDVKGEPEEVTDNHYYLYMILNILAVFVYIINGLIDVIFAFKARQRKRCQTGGINGSGVTLYLKKTSSSIEEGDATKGSFGTTIRTIPKRSPRSLRDNGSRQNMNASVFFCIAAFFGILEMVTGYQDAEYTSENFGEISTFMYLFSAFCALDGRESSDTDRLSWVYTWWDSDRLTDLGDILFGLGTLLDTILIFTEEEALWWQVIAASLWLADAFLYLRADYVDYIAIRNEMSPVLDGKIVPQLLEDTEFVLSPEVEMRKLCK